MVQTAYNALHKIQWHWELPYYLVTKGIAGGLFMLLCLGAGLGMFTFDSAAFLITGFTAMVFMLITVILLLNLTGRHPVGMGSAMVVLGSILVGITIALGG